MRKIKVAPFMPTEVEVNEISANRAEIIAYPFESGYAVTLAHPLRRLILGSSIVKMLLCLLSILKTFVLK